MFKLIFFALSILCMTACTAVKPWERESLARPEMSWNVDSIESAMEKHIYFSKEGSSGGGSAAGGGCGCN